MARRKMFLLPLCVAGAAALLCVGLARSAPKSVTVSSDKDAGPVTIEDGLSLFLSPDGGCTDVICRDIGNAKRSVHVQAAQFSSKPITRALIAAKQRGLDVVVITDKKKEDEDSQSPRLVAAGVPVFHDGEHHTAHNKVIVIDGALVFTGSFNFTKESESENAENLLRIENKPKIAHAYEANFKAHLTHSAAAAR